MASNGATVRHATREDVNTIYDLIIELADYEKAKSSVKASPEILAKTLAFHDPSTPDTFTPGYARTFLLVAPEGEVAGMALYFYNYSTWTGVPGVYLEDLFVKTKYRKRGYGKALIKACAKECLRINGQRLEWSCLDWNTPSLEFYESLGATQKKEWVGLRAEGDALAKLAEN
ncbi:GCN5-related N-acetyltransferase-like protein [Paraphaeosphaeria sporulosa]|uniref:GCN5-related N-acetyltransferas-like protein n=1 Tax=Paraphaeosphaeria sporulosa TaxID=1460663 RepID=A0A177C233_9PLEO|nr:GCN5-related N-acetyltransferase-like protein [Paraphaeosphaeria sporulosa]OAG00912.1 GCN5-related N-acetyltransferas-like protein [Paraphaeosphaeria sporulosa]